VFTTRRHTNPRLPLHYLSPIPTINVSVIHGSVFGEICSHSFRPTTSRFSFQPALQIRCRHLRPLDSCIRFAILPRPIQHITNSATANNLTLNNSKSQEMIVHLPRSRKHFLYTTAIPDIVRVDKVSILGKTVSNTLIFNFTITSPPLLLKALVLLCSQNHSPSWAQWKCVVWDVTRATLVSQVTTPVCKPSCLMGISKSL